MKSDCICVDDLSLRVEGRSGGRAAAIRRPPRVRDLALRAIEAAYRWQQRARDRHALAALDDRMLRDIGVGRAEVCAEVAKPFWRA